MILLSPQVYREFHMSIVIARRMRMKMKTRVPRNLFGAPERKESMHLLQDSLNQDRVRFHKRWSVDPFADGDDKENGLRACKLTPKKRSSPYAKQTSIHDYWRTRKTYDPSKKSPSACTDAAKPQMTQTPPRMQSLSLVPPLPQHPLTTADSPPTEPQGQSTKEAHPPLDTAQHTENQL